jgi:hypothetical protein
LSSNEPYSFAKNSRCEDGPRRVAEDEDVFMVETNCPKSMQQIRPGTDVMIFK